MTLEEKKQIYLDRFPAIIGRRMAEQFNEVYFNESADFDINMEICLVSLILSFNAWRESKEEGNFWINILHLYIDNETIEHQQILDIFHKHGIKP